VYLKKKERILRMEATNDKLGRKEEETKLWWMNYNTPRRQED
jgi:hypothetical protein